MRRGYAEVFVGLAALAVLEQAQVLEVRDLGAVVDGLAPEDAPPLQHHVELDELALRSLDDFVALDQLASLLGRVLAHLLTAAYEGVVRDQHFLRLFDLLFADYVVQLLVHFYQEAVVFLELLSAHELVQPRHDPLLLVRHQAVPHRVVLVDVPLFHHVVLEVHLRAEELLVHGPGLGPDFEHVFDEFASEASDPSEE